MLTSRRFRFLAVVLATAAATSASPVVAQNLPTKLSDSVFWKLITEFSEGGGYFRSDNFVSNETTYQWVIPELLRTTKPGGVYLGVGPDQNFTYIVALKPKIAFVFDIRRQNMLTHLMYKVLIESSTDRADFISRLFSRARPSGLDSTSTAETIFMAFAPVPLDSARYRKNLTGIRDALTKGHGFKLSEDDLNVISYVYENFVSAGPELSYNFAQGRAGGFGRGQMPSYAALQVETDSAGVHRSYMANEANFRLLKEVEQNNLLVPLVGDFAGAKAIRTVGEYLKQNRLTVTAFYLSNVEQYLFQQSDDWRKFFTNVGTLPLDSSSTFIRSVFNGMGYIRSYSPYMRNQQLLASMLDQLKLFTDGRITWYNDVIQTSR
ncbi:MAG TPA: hypothetical protein VIP11_08220 [Gemmatimonadaceae bacterium]